MPQALSGLLILLYLIPGAALAWGSKLIKIPGSVPFLKKLEQFLLTGSLYILLFFMGLRLVADESIVQNLPRIGLSALLLATLSVLFSVLVALPFRDSARKETTKSPDTPGSTDSNLPDEGAALPGTGDRSHGGPEKDSFAKKFRSAIAVPLRLIIIVLSASILGLIFPVLGRLDLALVSDISLKVMLVAVGIGLGFTPAAQLGKGFGWQGLLLPLLTALASLLAGLLVAVLLSWRLPEGMAAAGGFGWYSLSGVLLTDLGYASLSAVAFLGNLFRESLALLSIPLLQKVKRTKSAVAAAGATSMDVSLSVLTLYGNAGVLPLAVYHGFVLSLLVPLIVPLLILL